MRLSSTVLVYVACVAITVALGIPLTLRRSTARRRIGSGGTFLSAAKTTTQDISEQEGNFMVNVGIGTPPQNFHLLVQHDRTDTYVLSKECDTGICPDHAKFDGSKSRTYTGHPEDEKCCLGTLTNTGFAFPAKDNIVLGDVTIRQATFAVVVNNSADRNERENVHFDGVLGLGVLEPNQVPTNPFAVSILTTALKQGAIDKTMYTVWLQRQDGGDCEQSKAFLPVVGSLTLGDVNKNKCDASSISWHTLTHIYTSTSYGFGWVIQYATKLDQISYGDHVLTLDNKTAWAAKFAPQYEAVMHAPSTITDDIAKRVGANIKVEGYNHRYYPIDCKAKTPDDMKIVMGGKEYVIPGKHLIDRFYYPRACFLNVIATYPPMDNYYEFVIGTPFLREYCQTYDAANSRIGFSKNVDTVEMDSQRMCSGATTSTGLSVMVVVTFFAILSIWAKQIFVCLTN